MSSSSSHGSILWTANADGSDKKFVALQKDPNFFAMEGNTLAWSPDVETIACAVVENSGDGLNMSLIGYNVQDSRATRLTSDRWNVITGVAWAGDGSISGNKQQGEPSQVWRIPADGGPSRRITNDLNNYRGISMQGDSGAFVTVQTEVTSSIWTGKLTSDAASSDFKSEYREVGDIPTAGWTINGDLVYVSTASGSPELWLKVGGRARQLTTDARVSDFAVSPDGRYIVLVSNRAGNPNLWRIDANGGGLKQLTHGDGEVRPRFGADGDVVFFQKGFGNVRSSLWSVSTDGNGLRQLTEPHQIYADVSPDGKQIIYSYMDAGERQWRLGIARVEAGKQFESFAVPGSVTNRVTRWTPDNRGFMYINTVGGVSNIWVQRLGGGPARPVTNFSSQQIETFDLSSNRSLVVVRSHKANDAVLLIDGG